MSSTGWSRDAVLSMVLTDIGRQRGGPNRPDLVFLTGDAAFSSTEEESRLAGDFVHPAHSCPRGLSGLELFAECAPTLCEFAHRGRRRNLRGERPS